VPPVRQGLEGRRLPRYLVEASQHAASISRKWSRPSSHDGGLRPIVDPSGDLTSICKALDHEGTKETEGAKREGGFLRAPVIGGVVSKMCATR